MKKIAVIIPTSNRREQFEKCLLSLKNQTYRAFDTFAVINGSSDGSKVLVQKSFPKVSILESRQMLGSAGGYKKGIEQAYKQGYDWFWLMDDDAWADRSSLEHLVKISKFDEGRVFTAVGINPEKTKELSWQTFFLGNGKKKIYRFYQDLGKEDLVELEVASYVGLFFSRSVVEQVGYPNTDFFTWGDDVDYCLRIKRAGYRMFYIRSSLVFHPNPTNEIKLFFKTVWIVTGPPWKEYYILRNHVYVWLKYNNKVKTLLWQIPKQFVLYVVIVGLFEDQKIKRIIYYTRAFIDSIFGRLGRTITPEVIGL